MELANFVLNAPTTSPDPSKLIERVMVLEHRGEYSSKWAAIESIAPKIGCVPRTMNEWVRKHEVETGIRDGVTSSERERAKVLEREVKELRKANEILKWPVRFTLRPELNRRFKSCERSLMSIGYGVPCNHKTGIAYQGVNMLLLRAE